MMLGGAPRDHGQTIAEYTTYEAAQRAVSDLIEKDVPAKDIAIVGRGLRSVEKVTGRLGYATAARSGAINGILLGLLFAAIFVLGSPTAALPIFVGVMLVGIAIGMLMSIISYSIIRRRRDFTSVTQVIADHYDVTVLARSLAKAQEILGRRPAPTAAPPVDLTTPPAYGERIAPAPQYGERVDPAPAPEANPAPGPGPDGGPANEPAPPAGPSAPSGPADRL